MSSLSIEESLKLWTEKLVCTKRKDLSPGELCSLFQQQDLCRAFYRIIDRDSNGSISLEEWTGCISKLIGETDEPIMNWFVDKFNACCSINDTRYLTEHDFRSIAHDVEFGYRFAAIVSPRSRRINVLQLITSLEILASMSTDSKWLSWLKFQFTDAMIKSNRYHKNELYVTLDDFKTNFNFKEPFLAERLFSFLDKDQSGTLTLHKFINGLEVVVNGNQEAKIQFLFGVFDVDSDGRLDFDEIKMMLKCCLEESPSLDMQETVDDLAAILFQDVDGDQSGDISLDELKAAFRKHESLFKTLSVSTSIWIKPKFASSQPKHQWYHKLKERVVNKRPQCIFWTLYTVISLACIIAAYEQYANETSIHYIFARIFGNLLNFNSSLILVLVLRKHLTWMREKGAAYFIPIDDSIEIHKQVGIIIAVYTVIHTFFHMMHLYHECREQLINFWTALFTAELSVGYPTGIIEFFILLIILVFAMPYVRNKGFFQVFYWFHLLTIPWLLIMAIHSKAFWKWLLAPMFCYAVEKILRYRKVRSDNFGDTFIAEACVLPSKVTHLVVRRPPKFHFKPGDYVYINIPIVAKYEWHPFSISSAPENSEFIWLHIKSCGNWTKRLYQFASSARFDAANNTTLQLSGGRGSVFGRGSIFAPTLNIPTNTSGSNTVAASNARHSMRTRMSVILLSESHQHMIAKSAILSKQLSTISDEKEQEEVAEEESRSQSQSTIKKVVSFGTETLMEGEEATSKTVALVPNKTESTMKKSVSYEPNSVVVVPPARHKGILKVMMMQDNPKCDSKTVATTVATGPDGAPTNLLDRSMESQVSCMGGNVETLPQKEVEHTPSESTPKGTMIRKTVILTESNNLLNTAVDKEEANENEMHAAVIKKLKFDLEQLPLDRNTPRQQSLDQDKSTIAADHAPYYKKNRSKSIDVLIETNNGIKESCLDKLSEHFKSLDLQAHLSQEQVKSNFDKMNLADEYFSRKESEKGKKESKEETPESPDLKNDKQVVVLNMNDEKDNNNNISAATTGNSSNHDDNILGYMKLYRKHNRVSANTIGLDEQWRLKVFLDGPYGTPSQSIFDAEHAVLVAAGIGITPFASILQSLMNRYRRARASCPNCDYRIGQDPEFSTGEQALSVRKVDFIWITREQRSLEWFISMLSQMEIEQAKQNQIHQKHHNQSTSSSKNPLFLETHLYVTSAKRQSDLRSISLHLTLDAICSQEDGHLIDGLKKRTHFGRPNWDIVLQSLIRKQKGKINMFYCGPPNLSSVLQKKCNEYNIVFKKEIF